MKEKIRSRVLAVLLSAAIIASALPAASLTASAESMPSSSKAVEYQASGSSIPTSAMNAFNDAVKTYQGGTLTPLACYGSQVVAGMNYSFICRMNSDNQDDLTSLKFVKVYSDINGISTISEVSDLNIADYETDHSYELPDAPINGGMEVVSGLDACELPDDAQIIFNRMFNNIVGVSVVPIAYLGKKTNDGIDYVYLVERSAVVPDPDIFVDILVLHEDTDGAAGQKSSYSILGTRTNFEPDYNDDGKMTYEFKGDFKNTPGYAEGTITLQALKDDTFKLYWADDNEALDGYYPIAEKTLKSGESMSVDLGYHTVIPANATKIIAVTDSLDTSDAYSVFTIPSHKRLNSVSGNLLYSFSAYSDIHIDKGSLWYVDAEKNFKEGLKYSKDKNTDFIVVSGDCVTNDSGPDKEWNAYAKILSESDYVNPVWESDGNHDLRQSVSSGLKSFIKGSGTDGSQSGKSYFSMIEPHTGDLFLFMSIELDKAPNLNEIFSDEQLAWADQTIGNYYDDRNVFIVQHSPIEGYGAGDRMSDPYYGGLMNPDLNSAKKFKALLEKYPNAVFLSGHTHEDFTMDYNYSDENGSSANMIHIPALAGSTMPNSADNGLERNGGKGFNSQGYYVEVYENEIVFYGANITDKKIYPKYSYIMEGLRTSYSPITDTTDDEVTLLNNTVDIRQELNKVSYVLTQYYKFASYDSYQWLKKLYYIYKGETNADESVITQFEDAIEALSKYTGTINYYPLYKTYYFRNNNNWDNVYLYAWTGSSSNAAWPGKKLQKIGTNENGESIYSVTFDTIGEYQNIIFNAGSNTAQTVDVALHDHEYDGFYISGSSDGKYTVGNFDYNGETPPEQPIIEEPETHDDYALLYYLDGEHDWTDHSTLFTYVNNGIYRISYDATSDKNFSFSLYNKATKKYFSLDASAAFTYELGQTCTNTVKEMSSRGKSVSIFGLADKAHFDIEFNSKTNEVTVICPQPEAPALINNSTVSAETISLGETVTINAAAEGGTAPYTYEYYVMQNSQDEWFKLNVSDTETSASFKPDSSDLYFIKVIITDSLGKTDDKAFNVTVNPAELINESTVSSENVNVGTTVKVNGSATGGTAPYTYTYSVKRESASSWTVKATDTSETSITLSPTQTEIYYAKVVVKDAAGNMAAKTFTINVKSDPTLALTNTASLSAASVVKGSSVTVTGSAKGGTSPYKYTYQVKGESASSWTTKAENSSVTSLTLKPSMVQKYYVKVTVTDSAGKSAAKTLTLTVTGADLTNNSSLSSTTVTHGSTVTVKGAATGGTAPYKYTYQVRGASASSWTTKAANTTSTSISLKPSQVQKYYVKVAVTDAAGTRQAKTMTLTVKPAELTNTSTLSSTLVQKGTTVTVKGSATGGTAPYKYTYQVRRASASSWTTKAENTTETSITLKPTQIDKYYVRVIIIDSVGTRAAKTVTLKVTADPVLTNTSTLSASSVTKGTTVTINGSAAGGTAPYTYAYYVKQSTSSEWKAKGTVFTTETSATITPTQAVNYDVKVDVKDSTGTVATKTFTVTVK